MVTKFFLPTFCVFVYLLQLGVLKKYSDSELENVAQFRSKGRLPVCYILMVTDGVFDHVCTL